MRERRADFPGDQPTARRKTSLCESLGSPESRGASLAWYGAFLSGAIPLYTVNEFPKPGGTWIGQMLARALEVLFPIKQPPCTETVYYARALPQPIRYAQRGARVAR